MLDAKFLVLRRYPGASATEVVAAGPEGPWPQWEVHAGSGLVLGLGPTEARAWEDVVIRHFLSSGLAGGREVVLPDPRVR